MFLSNLSIERPVMITMLILVFLVFGGLAYFSLALNMMPEVDVPFVTIQVIYPGASPAEVETQIAQKIEDAVSTVSRIDWVQSYSMESVGLIFIKFEMGKDIDIANQEVKDKIDAILNQLPSDAELPVISKFETGAFPIMQLVFTGSDDPRMLREFAERHLRDRFAQIEGVAMVNISGGEEREIRVELDDRVVYSHAISLPQLAGILAAQNANVPGGSFEQADQEYTVRFQGEYDGIEAIRNTEVPTAFGPKRLGELAGVLDTGARVTERTTYYNNIDKHKETSVVRISLIKSADGNAVDVARQVARSLPEIRDGLPEGTTIVIIDDESVFIKSSVDDTLTNILLGIIFTGIILMFFLHDIRSTLIVAVAMPTSIIATFLFMQISGFSLNILTLMGLSTSVGILVTNSVVVLENIFRFKRQGMERHEAAGKGTSEIAVAVIASTMTNIVVFLPIASMTSMVGAFFREFALTVTYATIFSLLVSFTLTPMLASRFLPRKMKKGRVGHAFDRVFDRFDRGYQMLLWGLSKSRWYLSLVLVVSLALLAFALGLVATGRVGFEFMPMLDQGNIGIEVELPVGYSLDETMALMEEIEGRVTQHPEVRHFLTTVGSLGDLDKGSNLGRADVKLVDVDEREMSTSALAGILITELSDIPNAAIRVSVRNSSGGGEAPIEMFLNGQDMETLVQISEQIMEKSQRINGLVNFTSSTRAGRPEIVLLPNRVKLAEVGAMPLDLAMTLRASVEGLVTTQYREGGEEYDLRVVLTEASTDSPGKIAALPVVTPTGTYRMSQLADVVFTSGVNKIIHRDKYLTISFTGETTPSVPLGEVVNELDAVVDEIDMPAGYNVKWGGDAEMMQETVIDMARTFILAIILTYMLLAAILESFTQPLLILTTLPLALIGVFGACWVTGTTLNLIAMMSIIMLVGIVVNNAILMLDYTNKLRREGRGPREALLIACPTKLRPIVMSSLAIMLGMLPMAIGIGSAGSEMRQPMGVVSIGGIMVSMVLTLVVIPTFYLLTTHRSKEPLTEMPGLALLENNED
ncbi:MAG: efflux RND transporter permease subunit [Candidatus Cloacimonetes bacterium]|nr:efflux RND transporter permease subunit [Candidatus Cloacimonadota bacterium]